MESRFLVLKKGEEVVKAITDFCEKNGIKAAYVSAIGAVSSAEIAFYDPREKQYYAEKIEEDLEIAGMTGNIAALEGKPVLHAHITLSDGDYKTYGGHLKAAVVSGTCEALIVPLNEKLERKHDEETGLNLIS